MQSRATLKFDWFIHVTFPEEEQLHKNWQKVKKKKKPLKDFKIKTKNKSEQCFEQSEFIFKFE